MIKLLKHIRDVLRGVVRPPEPDNDNDDNDNDDNDNDDNVNDDKDKFSEYQKVISSLIEEIDNNKKTNYDNVFINNLNNETSNAKSDGEHYARLIAYQNATLKN